jgi:hypothetical protein
LGFKIQPAVEINAAWYENVNYLSNKFYS